MSQKRFFLICLSAALVISILICLLAGCKTREKTRDKVHVTSAAVSSQESHLSNNSQQEAVDSSTVKKSVFIQESGNTKTTVEIELDSYDIDKEGNQTFKAKPGTKAKVTSESDNKKTTAASSEKQNNIKTSSSASMDSAGRINKSLKIDSASNKLNTNSKGSGTTWPWVAGIVLLVVGSLFVILNRKKPG